MYRNARSRAKRYGYPFEIDPEDCLVPPRCPILDIPLRSLSGEGKGNGKGRGHMSDFSPSLDKIDPALGYVKGNVIVVSMRANRLKGELTPDQLIELGRAWKRAARRKEKLCLK